ncbi:MAG: M23 family metallopeptidase [Firmicutes bacterium]|nr:M23 family metallopeptidase [Bacillota bacterium]MBQ7241469.1 M23 family metallopeptidase [Bacillota bacterium]MBR0104515.1 M23 family metallopeptidase [Bacillota bacterium]MBR2593445.1 M23 family metallopeptidase [Bacillota bacterium]
MFRSKKPYGISVETSKTASEYCNTNLTTTEKILKHITIAAIAGIISFSTLSASTALADNRNTKDLHSSKVTNEVVNESIQILSTDSFKDPISEMMEEEKRAAEEKAFLDSIEIIAKDYSDTEELKEALIKMSKEFDISNITLTAAFEKVDEMASIPDSAPVAGLITSKFGYRTDPFSGRQAFHCGLDIQNEFDSDVCATAYGTVIFADYYGGYGNYVQVDHGNGIVTCYGHLNTFKCKVGDIVSVGTPIGTMGQTGQATGVHVHYEVCVDGEKVDPLEYISDLSEMTFLE